MFRVDPIGGWVFRTGTGRLAVRWEVLVSFGVLLAILAWIAALPGPLWPLTPSNVEVFQPSAMRPVYGYAHPDSHDRLQVESADEATALQVETGLQLDASSFNVLRYRMNGFPETLELVFVWRRADDPSKTYSVTLPAPGLGTRAFELSMLPEWRGTIIELGLAQFPVPQQVDAAHAFRPFEILSLRLESAALSNGIRLFLDDLIAPRPWTQRSINSLGRELGCEMRPAIAPLIVAGAVLLAWLVIVRLILRRDPAIASMLLATSAILWFVADSAWQVQLLKQNELSRSAGGYGGIADADLAASAATARDWLSAYRPNAKTAVLASSSFVRTRLAYHLRPVDVSTEHGEWFESGDVPVGSVLIVHDSLGPSFRSGVLQWPEGRISGLRQIGTFGSLRMFEFVR